MRLFQSHLLFKIGLYATAIHLSTAHRNSGIPFVKSKCHRLSAQPYQVLFSTWALPPNRAPNPESAGRVRRGYRIECLSVCGHYRPNRTPGTKRGIGAHVRTARQSRDCLRVRPSRAPPLFVAVRSALGPVLPTHARARWRHFVASPLRAAPCGPFGVRFAQAT
jgi:hypothetical protein